MNYFMLQENNSIVDRCFKGFWGNPWNPNVIKELGAPDLLVHYPMHGPQKGHADVKKMMIEFREAFPYLNFWGVGELIAEGEYVVGRWDGGGTHIGSAFSELPIGSLPATSGKKIPFTSTTVFHVVDGKIVEEIGGEGTLTALQQLGLMLTE
jgi:predicted ester cyclase